MTLERSASTAPQSATLPRHVHCLGVGGAGVSGLARLLALRGHRVTGHDRAPSPLTEALAEVEVGLAFGDEGALLPGEAECVVRSAAVGETDPQVQAARRAGIPVWKYAEALGRFAPEGRTLAVAGTHGKTTTGWMLWHALEALEEPLGGPLPGALIGGLSRRFGSNAMPVSDAGWFAVEACEYDRSFHQLHPRGAVITNVDADHLDYYGTRADIDEAFAVFAGQVDPEGILAVGDEVPGVVEERARCPVWRLGRELEVELLGEERGRFAFRLRGPGFESPPVTLAVPGRFNVENAALALAAAVGGRGAGTALGGDALAAAAGRGLEAFSGVRRRFEPWGLAADVEVVHDYAHHPTEVRVTLEAAARAFPRRWIAVLFQPHQHSRTARFLPDFVESLRSASLVCVADVYGARAHIDGDLRAGAADLVRGLRRAGVPSHEVGRREVARLTVANLPPGPGALFVLGAGDIEDVKPELLGELALRGVARGRPRS